MDDFRKNLEAALLKYGYESPNESPSDDELLSLVRAMGDHMTDLENQLGK
jgi:N-acetyl-anhydromuramyl-L-alanine amidase AmpD